MRFAGEFCGGLHLPFGSFGQHRSNSTDAGRSESHPEKSGGLAGHFSSPVFMMLRGLFFAAPAETVAQMNMQHTFFVLVCSLQSGNLHTEQNSSNLVVQNLV